MSVRFVSGRDFLDKESKFEWIIPPFVTVGSSMMLYGKPGLGKSSLAAQLVHSLGTGDPWLGFPVHKTGKTLYLGLDMADAEVRRLLERTEQAGLQTVEYIILPRPDAGAEGIEFNIFNPNDAESLRALCEQERPIAVVVDAIQDSYEAPLGAYDVNQLIREVLKAYRRVIGDALLVIVNHERKGMRDFRGQEVEDEDSYMGGQAWLAKVAASLRLASKANKKVLKVRKTRIDKAPMSELELLESTHGFYEVGDNKTQMLMLWPLCIADAAERERAVVECTSQAAIFRKIGEICGESAETVKKAYQRAKAKGVHFAWAQAEDSEEGASGDNAATHIYSGVPTGKKRAQIPAALAVAKGQGTRKRA